MAAIRSLDRWAPQFPEQLTIRRWPPVMLLAVLVFTLVSAGMAVSAVANAMTMPVSPVAAFEAFADIMPEQPLTALEDYPCSLHFSQYTDDYYPITTSSCQMSPKSGPFTYIGVTGNLLEIRSVVFRVQGMRAGDLVARWGPPDAHTQYKTSYTMVWKEGMYANGKIVGRYSLWSDVTFVLFTPPYES